MYAKLFTSIYQGTLRGNSHGLLVFTNLLAHADQLGRVDVHPRAIAEEVGLTVEQVRVALDMLEAPDDESRSPECQGRRIVRLDEHRAWGWTVVNYLKYRAIRNEEDRREQNRESQRRYRERHKPASADVSQGKPHSAPSETDKPIQKQKQKQRQETNTRAARVAAAPLGVDDLVQDGVDAQHARDWLKARGKIPLTQTAWVAVKREAVRAGKSPAEAVRLSAENGWRGFKAEWVESMPRDAKASKPAWLAAREARMAEFTGKSKEIIDASARLVD